MDHGHGEVHGDHGLSWPESGYGHRPENAYESEQAPALYEPKHLSLGHPGGNPFLRRYVDLALKYAQERVREQHPLGAGGGVIRRPGKRSPSLGRSLGSVEAAPL